MRNSEARPFYPTLTVTLVMLLIGCTHSIRREGYVAAAGGVTTATCSPYLKSQGHFQTYDGKKLGRIELGDTGFSVSCSKDKAFTILRAEACKLGANFIDLVQETPPSLVGSSCYRLIAEFWLISDPNRSDIKANSMTLN